MTTQPLEAALACAGRAAAEAGELLRRAALDLAGLQVEEKAPGDVASRADREAEALLRARLREFDRDIGFVGEEGGGQADAGSPHWLVDPLDGSMNFVRGYPAWAVSIALVVEGEPVVGVVHDPCRRETIAPIAGVGGVPIDGAGAAALRAPRALSQAVVGTVFPKPGSPRLPQYLSEFARVVSAAGGVRRSGAMALELAWLATGRLDAFWEHDMAPWDAGAGMVLLREAGVRCVARDGQPWSSSRSLAAATPALLDDFVALLDGTAA